LFYLAADGKLMAVPVKLGAIVEAGAPQPLFPVPFQPLLTFLYAPSGDGQRFLLSGPAGGESSAAQPVTIVTNWQTGMKK
jgi:hypothetical protein